MKFKVGDVVRLDIPDGAVTELGRTNKTAMTVLERFGDCYTVAWSEDGDIQELFVRESDLSS